jgi:hypothetical protein
MNYSAFSAVAGSTVTNSIPGLFSNSSPSKPLCNVVCLFVVSGLIGLAFCALTLKYTPDGSYHWSCTTSISQIS